MPSAERARAGNQLEMIAENLHSQSDMLQSMVIIEGLDNQPPDQQIQASQHQQQVDSQHQQVTAADLFY